VRAALLLAAGVLLAPAARATWSIVAVDTRTGEVCIAAATCIPLDLEIYLPVVRVGVGGACAQSAIDSNGHNRLLIWNGLADGLDAEGILAVLLEDNPQLSKQYGIVTVQGEPVTFSGSGVHEAKYGVARTMEGFRYAIQGNVLAGIQVVTDAENAFLATEGDLSQRVLAAMEAARVFGGDGRCSCDMIQPTSCGCPPPSFAIADLTAFLIIARQGDPDGTCDPVSGCATAPYFCNLNAIGLVDDQDPVVRLHADYAAWRGGLQGRADQLRSLVEPRNASLPADGVSELEVEVDLRDIEGSAVVDESAAIAVERAYEGAPVAKVVAVERLSPGRFRVVLRARTNAGEGRWRIRARQGASDVLLWPELVVQVGTGAPGPVPPPVRAGGARLRRP
jgi:hypothetical protein